MVHSQRAHLKTFFLLAVFWTTFIVALTFWEYRQSLTMVQGLALTACETAWQKDLMYRKWASGHGGVYVTVTKQTQPNPDLKNIPERDITTPSGRQLTLMNPAYMNRQVYDLARNQYGVHGHITSLNPLRVENSPDLWEAAALKAFETGSPEIHAMGEIAGQVYMRAMRPLITEEACLKCHLYQGYKIGDIRGGISISVPWKPYRELFAGKMGPLYLELAAVWFIGILGLIFSTKQINTLFTAVEEANRKIMDLVYIDPLTGLANRRSLDATLTREVERGSRLGLPLSVILLDVDLFKSVNDTFGHTMGDKVLQAIAVTLSTLARPYDLVSRYGGEEFLILMPGAAREDGEAVAERFRASISAITIAGFTRQVTASFGVSSLKPGQPSDTLFERADQAMYRAKLNGRNRVELDNSNLTEAINT